MFEFVISSAVIHFFIVGLLLYNISDYTFWQGLSTVIFSLDINLLKLETNAATAYYVTTFTKVASHLLSILEFQIKENTQILKIAAENGHLQFFLLFSQVNLFISTRKLFFLS